MKKNLFLLLALLYVATMFAQTLPYPIDTINGKTFYRYAVQKGEGLYRISKDFAVSQEDIVKYNPELQSSGLKLGQTILIPVVLQVDSSKYTIHELLPKETLYSISKKYGVKIADIEQLNPETSKSMQIGQKLLIPIAPEIVATENEVKQSEVAHEVKQMEVIRVDTTAQPTIKEIVSTENESIPIVQELPIPAPMSGVIKLAVLLPFMTDIAERNSNIERFTEFYEGLLLAVNKAQTDGQHFEIYTFDTDKTEARIISILNDSNLLKADVIIGPAYQAQTKLVAEYAKQHQIPMIVPFTSKVADVATNPYVLQFNPSDVVEAQAISAWAEHTDGAKNWILFNDDNGATTELENALAEELAKQQTPLKKSHINRLKTDSVSGLFEFGKRNMVVLPWDKFNAAQTALAHLRQIAMQYRVCLVSEYAWQKEIIDLPHIYTNLFDAKHSFSVGNMAYKLARMTYFPYEVKNTSPQYDLLGYDLTCWIVRVLQQEGNDIGEKISATGEMSGLQSDMRFERVSAEGGWMNKALKVVE